jgi:hypothetical protein
MHSCTEFILDTLYLPEFDMSSHSSLISFLPALDLLAIPLAMKYPGARQPRDLFPDVRVERDECNLVFAILDNE